MKIMAAALICGLAISVLASPVDAQSYAVTDLGTLPGGAYSGAIAINNRGQVVGNASTGTGVDHAFLWSKSTGMIDLGLLHSGDGYSFANGVNNSSTVVGLSGTSAFIWTLGSGMRDLGTLGGMGATAYGINDAGQVVGTSAAADGDGQAFLWSASTGMQNLGTLGGGRFSEAYAINDSGQVAGIGYLADNVTVHAFLWTQSGGMQDLGTLGGSFSYATGINSAGQVTGYSLTSSNAEVAFLWDSVNGMRRIGIQSAGGTGAYGINDSDRVVGLFAGSTGGTKGFLWTPPGKFQTLNSLVSGKNPAISVATAINKTGQIAAVGGINPHALLLTPSANLTDH